MELQKLFDKKINELSNIKGLAGVFYSRVETKEIFCGNKYADLPVDNQTKFQAASISKFVGSLVSMMYLEKHGISLEKIIADELPIKVSDKTTLKHLLSHSAGINVCGFGGYEKRPVLSTTDIVSGKNGINHDKIEFNLPFGLYSYSGGGYCLAQYYIEKLVAKPFHILAKELLFGPLDLKNTTFDLIDSDDNCAHGYDKNKNVVSNGWNFYPESIAAGLWITPSELLTIVKEFMSALNGNSKIISQSVAKQIIQKNVDYMEDDELAGYGLGIRIYPNGECGHDGSNAGFKCRFGFDQKSDEAFVIMTNDDRAYDILFEY
jgi:CubicO group peptidase (beta-lactamase class C family)